jgi:membrane fusion protein (multidrug efflux system)
MGNALKKFSYVVLALVLLFAAIFFVKVFFFSGRVSTDDAQVDSHLISISSRIPGTVIQVLVGDNQFVKAGTPLVLLDPKDYKAQLANAKAALALAEKNYEAALLNVPVTHFSSKGNISQAQAFLQQSLAEKAIAKEKIAQLEAAITTSKANLFAAKARLALSKANYDRAKLLARNYVASQQQFDSFKTAYENDLASIQAAEAMLKQTKLELAESQSQLAAAEAGVKQAEARVLASMRGPQEVMARKAQAEAARAAVLQAKAGLKIAELQLSYTTIYAPEDGILTNKTVTVGEVISPGQQLAVLAPVHNIWVEANFKETDVGEIKPGDKAEITVDAFPGKTFHGKVESLGGATGSALSLFPPENATGNFVKVVQRLPIKIVFDPNEDTSMLRKGMSVEATVYLK